MSPVDGEFVDDPAELGRRTSTQMVSVLTRASTLGVISGAQALASMIAGLAALGREASTTIVGERRRAALEHGRVRDNLELLFSRFGLGALASISPPTPILEDFFNDLALLLAPDTNQVVDAAALGALEGLGVGLLLPPASAAPFEPLDFLLGLWTYSAEVAAAFDALSDDVPTDDVGVTVAADDEPGPGRLLR